MVKAREYAYLEEKGQHDHRYSSIAIQTHRQGSSDDCTKVKEEENPARFDNKASERSQEAADSKDCMSDGLVVKR